ncbi:hypothetical protein C6P77_02095 [Burkholderia ambifaria]|nr:hypothetical protein C6P77_02095 [Burkholderia ambifaria]
MPCLNSGAPGRRASRRGPVTCQGITNSKCGETAHVGVTGVALFARKESDGEALRRNANPSPGNVNGFAPPPVTRGERRGATNIAIVGMSGRGLRGARFQVPSRPADDGRPCPAFDRARCRSTSPLRHDTEESS